MSNRMIKCVVVGDSAVGKTWLVVASAKKISPVNYFPPMIPEDFTVNVMIGGELHTLHLWDTQAQEEYDRLRLLFYPYTDVFLICFSVVAPSSFENVKKKWLPEIELHKQNCDDARIILVGTKIDLRDDSSTVNELSRSGQRPISFEQGTQLAGELKMAKYVECSALTRVGLENVFEEATLAALDPRNTKKKKRKSNCTAL